MLLASRKLIQAVTEAAWEVMAVSCRDHDMPDTCDGWMHDP